MELALSIRIGIDNSTIYTSPILKVERDSNKYRITRDNRPKSSTNIIEGSNSGNKIYYIDRTTRVIPALYRRNIRVV